MQDVTKFKLLCTSCESLFAVNEQKFAERVYKPFQSDRKMQQFEYGSWLSHFVISLIWRMVAVDYAALAVEFPNHAECAARAFEHWRLFLLKKHNKIKPYAHHLFFFTFVDESSSGLQHMPEKLHTYVHWTFDGEIAVFGDRSIVYVLLPGVVFWSPLYPHDDKGWQGSAVTQRGRFGLKQVVSDIRFSQHLHARAKLLEGDNLSENQRRIVNAEHEQLIENNLSEEVDRILRPAHHDQYLKALMDEQTS